MKTIFNKIESIENAIFEARRELDYIDSQLEDIKNIFKRKNLTPEAFIYKDGYFIDDKYIASLYIIELIKNVNLENLDQKLQNKKELKEFAEDYVDVGLIYITKEDLIKHGLVDKDFLEYFSYKYRGLDFYVSVGTNKIIIKKDEKFIGLIVGMRRQIENFSKTL